MKDDLDYSATREEAVGTMEALTRISGERHGRLYKDSKSHRLCV